MIIKDRVYKIQSLLQHEHVEHNTLTVLSQSTKLVRFLHRTIHLALVYNSLSRFPFALSIPPPTYLS